MRGVRQAWLSVSITNPAFGRTPPGYAPRARPRPRHQPRRQGRWHSRRPVCAASGTPPQPFNFAPMGVNSFAFGSPHVRPTGVHRTCGGLTKSKKNTHPEHVTALDVGRAVWHFPMEAVHPIHRGMVWDDNVPGNGVRIPSRLTPTPWRAARVRPALRTYDAPPWGCIVRVASQAKSRKIPNPKCITALFLF